MGLLKYTDFSINPKINPNNTYRRTEHSLVTFSIDTLMHHVLVLVLVLVLEASALQFITSR